MNINIRLNKNFTSQYNRLQEEFGSEIARLNGFDDNQLSYTDFIDNFIDKENNVADASIDSNANVGHKDIVSLEREMPKTHSKLLAFNKIYYDMQKLFGFNVANKWLRMEWIGKLYLHDAPSSSMRPYCFAYDLKDLAEKGLYFISGQNPCPAKHLTTFVDFVKEFVSLACNRTSGAVGLPNLIPYMYYFWHKDCADDYLGIKTSGCEEKYARQNFQRFIYAVNQPYVRDGSQSAFTNTSVFDRPYFEALFGGSTFPDGSFMIDFEEEMIEFQKWYMEVMSEIRSENMFTFPVSTISLLRQDGKFVDEEFAKWGIKHNMKWSDSNLFIDDSVTSLSNCCFAPDQIFTWYDSKGTRYQQSIGEFICSKLSDKQINSNSRCDIEISDTFVKNKEGNLVPVVYGAKLPNDHKKLVIIELEDGTELKVTPDQLIWDNNSQRLVTASKILSDPDKYDI